MASPDIFRIGKFELTNRLFVGTGKYSSYEIMQQALDASGCQVVTVAVRRERLVDKQGRSLLDFLDLNRYIILPNTAGCFSAEDAIRVALGPASGGDPVRIPRAAPRTGEAARSGTPRRLWRMRAGRAACGRNLLAPAQPGRQPTGAY